jgi:ring-1,2-phenylacetyl-CoA epoxidase subunit PaaD
MVENMEQSNEILLGTQEKIWQLLDSISDPEIPVLSVTDLGIIRNVISSDDASVTVEITPTYSGCPAMDMIATTIKLVLNSGGFSNVKIKTVYSPAWTTDWMTGEAKEKLLAYGIAPPAGLIHSCAATESNDQQAIQCPHCRSYHTRMVSRFGSTACKALYQCNECGEPFDYFKCH